MKYVVRVVRNIQVVDRLRVPLLTSGFPLLGNTGAVPADPSFCMQQVYQKETGDLASTLDKNKI